MNIEWSMTPVLMGIGFGFAASVIGAVLQYWFSVRKGIKSRNRLPGLILIVSGLLGLTGLLAIIISLFFGWTTQAILIGAGVLIGFFAGFLIMVLAWAAFRPAPGETR